MNSYCPDAADSDNLYLGRCRQVSDTRMSRSAYRAAVSWVSDTDFFSGAAPVSDTDFSAVPRRCLTPWGEDRRPATASERVSDTLNSYCPDAADSDTLYLGRCRQVSDTRMSRSAYRAAVSWVSDTDFFSSAAPVSDTLGRGPSACNGV